MYCRDGFLVRIGHARVLTSILRSRKHLYVVENPLRACSLHNSTPTRRFDMRH